MDSREPPPSQPLPLLQQQPHQPFVAPNMMMGPNSYHSSMPNLNTSSMISPNSTAPMMAPNTAQFPFSFVVPQPPTPPKPSEALNSTNPYDGSSSALRPCGFSIDSQKKKKGRSRKYSPDGNIALGLAPAPISSSAAHGDSSGTPLTKPFAKKSRGRPPKPKAGGRMQQLPPWH